MKSDCECTQNATAWVKLCQVHAAELAVIREAGDLESLLQLINYYEHHPDDGNLSHVVTRIKSLGAVVSKEPRITTWVRANSAKIIDWSRRHVAA